MLRLACLALALGMVGPAIAEPLRPVAPAKPAPLIDPVTLKVNEGAAKWLDAEQKARDLAWDMKLKRTMVSVCRGC